MVASSELRQRFEIAMPHINALAKEVRLVLLTFCEERGFAFQSRLKTLESLAEKIEAGTYSGWSDLDDLFACTIIVPTLNEEAIVAEFCDQAFLFQSAKRRGMPDKSFEVFRFDATRLYYRLKPPTGEDVDDVERYRLLFEVQVKSAFDHAWSTATHALTYKSNRIDWRRLRLSAQIKAMVEQMDMAIIGFEAIAPLILENPDRRLEIKKRVGEIFQHVIDLRKLPPENLPKDLSRFVDNFVDMVRACGKQAGDAVSVAEQLAAIILVKRVEEFPRSVSLLQYCFAEATLNSIIRSVRNNYATPVTDELLSLYPHVIKYN
jgi:ppGpp synthetase/RelA/SpoT-type nucleotidyltranferase